MVDFGSECVNLTKQQFFHFCETKYTAQITQINKPIIFTVFGKWATALNVFVLFIAMF
jgi:hypothetical protein